MINMGVKDVLKRGKKLDKAEAAGALLVVAPAYADADFRAVKQMIIEGAGPAYAFNQVDRRKAVEAMEIMITRDPSTLGKIIDRILSAPTVVGPVLTLINYKDSRR